MVDNPPAFPGTYAHDGHNGMSLRDWFAGQVLAGLPSRRWDYVGIPTDIVAAWAKCAYATADAMLAERAETHKEQSL